MKKCLYMLLVLVFVLGCMPARASILDIIDRVKEEQEKKNTPAPTASTFKDSNWDIFGLSSKTPQPAEDSRYLLSWNGFTVEVLRIERILYSSSSASIHFVTRCVNHSGHDLNLRIDDASVNGVHVSSCGITSLFEGYDSLKDHADSDDFFFLFDNTTRSGVEAICNAKSAVITFLLVDGNTYDELFRQTVVLNDLGLPAVTPMPTVESTPRPEYFALCEGDSGEAVRRLQQRLIALGYLNDMADGRYGKRTAAAVRDFCKANGITATEIATPMIQEKIYASDAKAYVEPYVPLTIPIGSRGEWEKLKGDKIKIRVKLTNASRTKTIKAFELYMYAEDVWGDRIYGEDTVYYDTTTRIVKPGEAVFSDYMVMPNCSQISKVYVGVKKIVFTDGIVRENSVVSYDGVWDISW